MSKRSDLVYLGTILDAALRVARKAEDCTKEQFASDENLQLALTYLLQNVGEAAAKAPPHVHAKYPHIEWLVSLG